MSRRALVGAVLVTAGWGCSGGQRSVPDGGSREASVAPDAHRALRDSSVRDSSFSHDVATRGDGQSDASTVCLPPSSRCGASCSDPETDVHHCGGCDTDCTTLAHVAPLSATCQAGACAFACAAGYGDCDDAGTGCATSLSSATTCGSCFNECTGDTPSCAPADGGASSDASSGVACTAGCPLSREPRCGGVCADTQADPYNCGRCGLVCGGQCELGRCLVNLAPANPSYDSAYDSVAMRGGVVYWVSSGIVSVPTTGGTPVTTQVEGYGVPFENLAIGPNGVFVGGTQGIVFLPFDGGAGRGFLGDPTAPSYAVHSIAAGTTQLYWVDTLSGDVLSAGFDGGAVTVVATDQGSGWDLAAGSSSLYWTTEDGDTLVTSASLDGGALTSEPWSAQQLLWAGGDLYFATSFTLSRVPGGQGAPIVLVSDAMNIGSFAVDSTTLYWADLGTGNIMSESIQGGASVTLATGQTNTGKLLVDATSLYWINWATEELMKLTPK
jgi:hypothetical protein